MLIGFINSVSVFLGVVLYSAKRAEGGAYETSFLGSNWLLLAGLCFALFFLHDCVYRWSLRPEGDAT